MSFIKLLSPIIGFGTIGLLSSIFAKLQGALFPASLQLFDHLTLTSYEVVQLIIKLACVYISCIAGGVMTSICGGERTQLIIVGISIMSVIIWLWIIAIHPLWFWTLLLVGIIPFVLIGSKVRQAF